MIELDTSRAPRGVLAASRLVAEVVELGDLAERHYLELKSTLDLSQKKDKEKIAKFILGSANRMPDVAQSAFEGVGVMLIRVEKGKIDGIPPVEMMDISKGVQKFLGANGPKWDVLWVPIENSTQQVLVVLVDAPKWGQGPFPCRANGESLKNGHIYVRSDGETRQALADELDLLVERGQESVEQPLDFSVELTGEIPSVECDEQATIETHVAMTRARLLGALLTNYEGSSSTKSRGLDSDRQVVAPRDERLADRPQPLSGLFTTPENRTEKEYREAIDEWETEIRKAWVDNWPRVLAAPLGSNRVRITNNTDVFLRDVQLKIRLEGEVIGCEWEDVASFVKEVKFPDPPREWGLKPQQPPFGPYYDFASSLTIPRGSVLGPTSVTFENSGSVDLTVDVGVLRPREVFETDPEEFVLLLEAKGASEVAGTWEITAAGRNQIFRGELSVPVRESRDFTEIAQILLGIDVDDQGDDNENTQD